MEFSDFDDFDIAELTERLFDQCGLSDQQRIFARARLDGHNQGESARLAGYAQDAKGGRWDVAGSKVQNSVKVKRALAKARELRNKPIMEIGDFDELHKLLWAEARNGDGATKMRALELLSKIEVVIAESRSERDMYESALGEIAERPRLWILLHGGGVIDAPEPDSVKAYRDKHPRVAVMADELARVMQANGAEK